MAGWPPDRASWQNEQLRTPFSGGMPWNRVCPAVTSRSTNTNAPGKAGFTIGVVLRPSSGAPAGNRNALRHGRYSHEMLEFRRMVRELAREARELVEIV
jgi:hypothetical protein